MNNIEMTDESEKIYVPYDKDSVEAEILSFENKYDNNSYRLITKITRHVVGDFKVTKKYFLFSKDQIYIVKVPGEFNGKSIGLYYDESSNQYFWRKIHSPKKCDAIYFPRKFVNIENHIFNDYVIVKLTNDFIAPKIETTFREQLDYFLNSFLVDKIIPIHREFLSGDFWNQTLENHRLVQSNIYNRLLLTKIIERIQSLVVKNTTPCEYILEYSNVGDVTDKDKIQKDNIYVYAYEVLNKLNDAIRDMSNSDISIFKDNTLHIIEWLLYKIKSYILYKLYNDITKDVTSISEDEKQFREIFLPNSNDLIKNIKDVANFSCPDGTVNAFLSVILEYIIENSRYENVTTKRRLQIKNNPIISQYVDCLRKIGGEWLYNSIVVANYEIE